MSQETVETSNIVTTTHNSAGKAVIKSVQPAVFFDASPDGTTRVSKVYSHAVFPVDMNDEKDLEEHRKRTESGEFYIGLKGGTVGQFVTLAPKTQDPMHRTVTFDYGIVIDGQLELQLDDGEKVLMNRGDVVLQRGNTHAWRNPSETEWARIFFVVVDAKPVEVGGKTMDQDLSGFGL